MVMKNTKPCGLKWATNQGVKTAVHMALICEVRVEPEKAIDSICSPHGLAILWIGHRKIEYMSDMLP